MFSSRITLMVYPFGTLLKTTSNILVYVTRIIHSFCLLIGRVAATTDELGQQYRGGASFSLESRFKSVVSCALGVFSQFLRDKQ